MEQDASEGWQKRLPTVKLQAEFFLMKFTDIERKRVEELAEDFKKFDSRKKGELQEDEVRFILLHLQASKILFRIKISRRCVCWRTEMRPAVLLSSVSWWRVLCMISDENLVSLSGAASISTRAGRPCTGVSILNFVPGY